MLKRGGACLFTLAARAQEEEGRNSNVIESFFSRVEKAYKGINHRFSPKCLDWYIAMLSRKEDTRYMGLQW